MSHTGFLRRVTQGLVGSTHTVAAGSVPRHLSAEPHGVLLSVDAGFCRSTQNPVKSSGTLLNLHTAVELAVSVVASHWTWGEGVTLPATWVLLSDGSLRVGLCPAPDAPTRVLCEARLERCCVCCFLECLSLQVAASPLSHNVLLLAQTASFRRMCGCCFAPIVLHHGAGSHALCADTLLTIWSA